MTKRIPTEIKLEVGTVLQNGDFYYFDGKKSYIQNIGFGYVVESDSTPIFRPVSCTTCKHSSNINGHVYCSKALMMVCGSNGFDDFEIKIEKIPSTRKLKLFVWEGVLSDYTDGVMFALAHTVEEARLEILKSYDINEYKKVVEGKLSDAHVWHELKKPYTVHETPIGFNVWGGG